MHAAFFRGARAHGQGKAKTKAIFKLQDQVGACEGRVADAGRRVAAAGDAKAQQHAAVLDDALKVRCGWWGGVRWCEVGL